MGAQSGKGGNFPVLPLGGHMVASESIGALGTLIYLYILYERTLFRRS